MGGQPHPSSAVAVGGSPGGGAGAGSPGESCDAGCPGRHGGYRPAPFSLRDGPSGPGRRGDSASVRFQALPMT